MSFWSTTARIFFLNDFLTLWLFCVAKTKSFIHVLVLLSTSFTFLIAVKREYSEKKIEENISAEIFQVCLDEAMESYKPDIVWELANNTMEDMESNVEKIVQFVKESGPSM